MWPTWVFSLMLIVAGCLALFLFWELLRDVNCTLARWWIARRNQRQIQQWEAARSARLREVLR